MIKRAAMSTFVAIDFETATHQKDSACAVGLATGRNRSIEAVRSFLTRPPESLFVFTGIHGLRWEDVRNSPTFGELWPTLLACIISNPHTRRASRVVSPDREPLDFRKAIPTIDRHCEAKVRFRASRMSCR